MQNLNLIFSRIINIRNIKIVLMNYKKQKDEMIYQTREIELDNIKSKTKLKKDINDKYIAEDTGLLVSKTVSNFDNEYLSNKIYKLSIDDELIRENCIKFINSIDTADVDSDPLKFKKGYALVFKVEEKNVFLISISSPHKTLKRAFFLNDRKYKEIDDKYLYLRDDFDLIIYDDSIYVFNDKVERLFDLERTFKIKSRQVCDLLERESIIDNINEMKNVINSNKRLCVKFNEETYDLIKNSKHKRKEVAKELNLKITKEGLIKIETIEEAKKLYEILCNKAMKNIVDDSMYRVSNAEKI
ncbi:MAG: DUF4868 domain-containing protein [Lachnospiraceae bacterium]|nr:DUF4868 domain-containing protein [Lachnospiraceae bacterium]